MRSVYDITVSVSFNFTHRQVWFCLIFLLSLDCSQVSALPYAIDKKNLGQEFYLNIEEIQNDAKIFYWIEASDVIFDENIDGWKLVPYPIHMDGKLYYAFIFEEQSILLSQVQGNTLINPQKNILPIPECPTLVLIGIGLFGICIRSKIFKKTGFCL